MVKPDVVKWYGVRWRDEKHSFAVFVTKAMAKAFKESLLSGASGQIPPASLVVGPVLLVRVQEFTSRK